MHCFPKCNQSTYRSHTREQTYYQPTTNLPINNLPINFNFNHRHRTKYINLSDKMSFCKFFKSSILASLVTSVTAARIGHDSVAIEQEHQKQQVQVATSFVQSARVGAQDARLQLQPRVLRIPKWLVEKIDHLIREISHRVARHAFEYSFRFQLDVLEGEEETMLLEKMQWMQTVIEVFQKSDPAGHEQRLSLSNKNFIAPRNSHNLYIFIFL